MGFRSAAGALALLFAVLTACGGNDESPAERVGRTRRQQAERLAREAGLPKDVQEFLGLAAGAAAATFSVSYDTADKTTTLIQKPPARRVDVRTGTTTDTFLRLRDGAYSCKVEDGAPPQCTPADDRGEDPDLGVFAPEVVQRTVQSLSQSRRTHDFAVERRRLAGTSARCLVTTPKLGGQADELCVAGDTGAILRIRTADQAVDAARYSERADPALLRLPA